MGDGLLPTEQMLGLNCVAIISRNFTWQTSHDPMEVLGQRWVGPGNTDGDTDYQDYDRLLFMHFRDTCVFEKDVCLENNDWNNWSCVSGALSSLYEPGDANGADGVWGNETIPDAQGRFRRFSHTEEEWMQHVPVPHPINDQGKCPELDSDGQIRWHTQVSSDAKEAITNANSPSESNPFATMADIGSSSSGRNIDGGSPDSVYLASQVINGGNP